MKPRKASLMAPIATARRRRSSVARATPLLPVNVLHEALLEPEDIAIDALDTLLNGLIRSMEENALRKATLAYTACVATSCVMGMLGMMMLPHTKTPESVDDAAEHVAPTPAPIDIWSKATVPSKRKPLGRSNTHRGTTVGGASPTRESQKSISPKRSPNKTAPHQASPALTLPETTTTSDVDVAIAVQFAASYVDVVPITLEELARRETIERILAADADRVKRIEVDEARARATATLVTDPDELEKQLPRPPDEPIESEVVLVDEKELLVGENSLLVSRRSKKDLLRRLPPPRLEPQIVVPSGDSARGQSPSTSRNARGASRGTSRASVRPKLTLKPKTPLSRLTPLNFSTPADNAKLFIRYEALNGGPVFDDASSPVSRGVVIRHKGFEKRGADWKASDTSDALSRTESEPTLRPSRKKRPSRADLVEANVLRVAPATPPVASNPPVLPQPVHHHDEVKSLTMRIRTPACRSRRSRRVVDVNDRDDAMIFEPQKVVLRQLKLPHIHDREASSSISVQNKSLPLPLLAGRSGTPPQGR
ncbi:hypothetical protein SDRG_14991 [Saprolegnia diclina VS20]|uniref:Uncharacterized protein n=1 Tax=Saprolegnia diclina (strain VS20) TaxID=1156394 RepID=T0R524_SAPDV|nr:hypothetical protein SDRG_14991 [Saprolegnia diclina VS20]EQC27188.1 hypothetical protein SDRG_14991 [Saprolegnia diclina VS20]|eukprot:XP_008619376.1 hypothetical protein SDRG_14991 [Saprolegnia diclina VS20]